MNKSYVQGVRAGDIIRYEMPPFCSGEYLALVREDRGGTYIDAKDNFFSGCKDYSIVKPEDDYYQTFKELTTNEV